MPHPKNYAVRDTIYDLIGMGKKQYEIIVLLREKGFNIKKSRLSQIIGELEQKEYIICNLRTVYKSYIVTKKPYPYKSRSLQTLRCGCKKVLRIHNQTFKYCIIAKSYVTNDPKSWDRIIPMRNSVIQYIYYGHDRLGQGLTVQRFEGKKTDTLMIKIADMEWEYDKLDALDDFIMRKCISAEYGIMHHFKMQMKLIGKTKTSYAIRPTPYTELQQAFQSDNYSVGGLQGDSSKNNIPELETDVRKKAVAIMEFLNLADSGRLPELLDVMKKIKDFNIPLETIIDVMDKNTEKNISIERENCERGVI
ncbi:MAG: hypothetical protein MUO82_08530 [Candidatus Thermoplasmatota archaeon]|nr:hypothetical protein [Candidatus Thermoplasmatota archaeon]